MKVRFNQLFVLLFIVFFSTITWGGCSNNSTTTEKQTQDASSPDKTPDTAKTPDASANACYAFCDKRAALNCPKGPTAAECRKECDANPFKPGNKCFAEANTWGACLQKDVPGNYECRDGKSQPKTTVCLAEKAALEKCAGIKLP